MFQVLLYFGSGFVTGLLFCLLIRVRLAVGEDIEKLVNQRAVELVRKALSHLDPTTKQEETTESDDTQEDD